MGLLSAAVRLSGAALFSLLVVGGRGSVAEAQAVKVVSAVPAVLEAPEEADGSCLSGVDLDIGLVKPGAATVTTTKKSYRIVVERRVGKRYRRVLSKRSNVVGAGVRNGIHANYTPEMYLPGPWSPNHLRAQFDVRMVYRDLLERFMNRSGAGLFPGEFPSTYVPGGSIFI
ncbi:MAG: hypothetical protein RL417_799 [Pseudomonadota bacterium]|jgi:hypothetical protein